MGLTKRQEDALREALFSERATLLRTIKQGKSQIGKRDGDTADISSFDRDADLLWELEEHESDRLLEIDDALERIRNRTYGICEKCGAAILHKRLAAIPTARLCVDCQVQAETEAAACRRPHEMRNAMPVEEVWNFGPLTRVVELLKEAPEETET